MKKLVAFLTALALFGGLTACERKKAEVTPDPSPSASVSPTPTPTPAPSPTPPTADVTLTYDPEELKPWQTAYIQLLERGLEQEKGGFAEVGELYLGHPYYYLYDINKNGLPELILMYHGEWDSVVYTYDQGEVVALEGSDMLDLHRGGFCSWPEKNGVLYVDSQFWDIYCELYYMDGDQLKWKEVAAPEPKFHEDGHIEEYPVLQDLYPDSRRLNGYYALVNSAERKINFLPIINYDPSRSDQLSKEQGEREKQRVQDVMDGDGWFYYVPDYYEQDNVGWMTVKAYCKTEGTTVSDAKWCDLNGDCVEDATLRFFNGDGLILSAQDGVVYGYPLEYSLNSYAWTSKERFVNTDPVDAVWSGYRVHFAKDQFYTTCYERETIFPREFWHMTGVGGWSTAMNVEKDGTFEGNYTWHRIAEEGEDWEMYSCNFSGKFSEPKQVNSYTYSVQLEKLDIGSGWHGMESDEASLTKVEGAAQGLEGGEEFLIYLPGAPVKELPEEFLSWSMLMVGPDDTVLPSYGLYNVNTQIGWFDW